MTTLATVPAPTDRPRRPRPLRLRPAPPLRLVTHPTPAQARPRDLPVDPPLAVPPLRTVPTLPEEELAAPRVATHLSRLTGPTTPPGQVCTSILQVAGEAMRGLRPLSQLVRWVDGEVFEELAAYAPRHGERVALRQRLEPTATAAVLARSRLRRVRVVRVSPTAVECTAVVEDAERVRAVVVRLEAHRDRWRATMLRAL